MVLSSTCPKQRRRPLVPVAWQSGAVTSGQTTRGPLTPIELATASVMAGVTVALVIVGWFFPHASGLVALAAVPLGVVAYRHRLRAVVGATVAAMAVGFLVGGIGPVTGIAGCALIGGFVGDAKRRGWGLLRVVAGGLVMGPAVAGLVDALFALLAGIRRLTLVQITNTWRGVGRILKFLGAPPDILRHLTRAIDTVVRDWWISIPVAIIVGMVVGVFAAWMVLGAVLDRLSWIRTVDSLDSDAEDRGSDDRASDDRAADDRPVDPVPVTLTGVSHRYPGADGDALHDITVRFEAGTFVGVLGHNGSGKSTLVRILAGRAPTLGNVARPGAPGLGRPGGTAIVAQRPESQVLGVRVADDIVWGIDPRTEVDVAGLLGLVGLVGMEERATATLSGGELQRLAIASALARRPRLLLSDESTAMVDADGRRALMDLLAGLPGRTGVTVVHVTHRVEEVERADRVITLGAGRMVQGADTPAPEAEVEPVRGGHSAGPGPPGPVLLAVDDVSHTYALATPWAQTALHDINLAVGEGEGLLIVGGNGSGKSTLAWILAGLTRPTAGRVTVAGRPITDQVGTVALSFQHARLQLQRPTVRADVIAASGVDEASADDALASVGLDPARFAGRRVEELSGGEMRRAALAGLLARRPRVLVLDEPLAGLDTSSRAELRALLAGWRAERRLTLIVISHDLEGMGDVCERLVRLDGGRITADRSVVGART